MMNWLTSNVKAVLAIFVTAATILYFFAVTLLAVNPDPQIIIAMVSINTTVLSYYFGSSQGMGKKDDLISTLSTTPPAVNTSGDINITPDNNNATTNN